MPLCSNITDTDLRRLQCKLKADQDSLLASARNRTETLRLEQTRRSIQDFAQWMRNISGTAHQVNRSLNAWGGTAEGRDFARWMQQIADAKKDFGPWMARIAATHSF